MIFDFLARISICANHFAFHQKGDNVFTAFAKLSIVHLVGNTLIAAGTIVAFRKLNIIGDIGTAILAFVAVCNVFKCLYDYKQSGSMEENMRLRRSMMRAQHFPQ